MKTGIYKITNSITRDCYIGSSINIYKRWSVHKTQLEKNCHSNKHLQSSWVKYGEKNFVFEIIEECKNDELLQKEQKLIDTIKPIFNKRVIAESNLGFKHSEETKNKIRKGNKLKTLSAETKLKIGLKSKGRTHSENTKQKMSNSRKGRIISEETRIKLSIASKGNLNAKGNKSRLGKIAWNKGLSLKLINNGN